MLIKSKNLNPSKKLDLDFGDCLEEKEDLSAYRIAYLTANIRVATVREKNLENEIFFRSGKSKGILWMAREI